MEKRMRVSVFLFFIAALLLCLAVPTNAAWPNPVAAMKTRANGYFYIPNASKIDLTNKTHIYYLRVDLWCNETNCSRMEGDQTYGTNPYPGDNATANWPSGSIDLRDTSFIASKNGLVEGDTAPPKTANWSYMADVYPDRVVDTTDTNLTNGNYGQSVTYVNNSWINIHIVFNTGQDIPVNSTGYAPIPAGTTSFTVYNGTNPVLATVTFYNTTSPPPPNRIYGVTLNSPTTDPMLDINGTFTMSCTPITDNSTYGINMEFEYNYTGNPNFVSIPTSGSLLTANGSGQKNLRNNTVYSRVIKAVGGNDYYVRCRLYNSTTNITTNAQKVTVRYPPILTIAEFRLYQGGSSYILGSGVQLCDISSSFGSSIPNSNCSNSGFYEGNGYRAELEICNDQLFGKDVSITKVLQGNLTSPLYLGFGGVDCESGNGVGNLNTISCDWNISAPNALYMDASSSPPLVGTKIANTRTSYSCRWYTYYFMPGPVVNDTLFVSNVTTAGASLGPNPQVGRLSIQLYTIANMKIAEFRLYQSSNMTTLGSGTQICDISSSFGNNIAENSTCSGLNSVTQYRAEVRVCQDWLQSGKSINISGVVHGNLTSAYIWNVLGYGSPISCANGNNALTPISCDWNTTVPNGVYTNASSLQFTTGNRTATSCQWFVYNFTTSPLLNNTVVNSNISTLGVGSGINPQVRNITIGVKPQSSIGGVTLNPPAADFNTTDLSSFGMTCTPNSGGGYGINVTFEYNSTTQGWAAIPASGANLTIDGNNPEVNVSNGAPYAHTVSVALNSFGTYWVRCRINNASTSLYSNIVKIGVYPGVLYPVIQNPSPNIYNISSPYMTGQYSTWVLNASVTCNSSASLGGCRAVSCSVRYNSSSNSADTIMSETPGALPFYIISANMTHDFTGIINPSTTNQMTYDVCSFGKDPYAPPTTIITTTSSNEAPTPGYAAVSSEDGAMAVAATTGLKYARIQQFRFQLNESLDSIRRMGVYYKGWSNASMKAGSTCDTPSYLTRFFVWNFTSGKWQLIGNHSLPYGSAISVNFTSGFSDIVNSNYLYLLASSDLGEATCWKNVSTDYIKVDVQLSNKSTVPCGSISANQTCKFSWLINSTGVNDLRAVDVNCSSNKSTVTPADSGDTYVYIKGVEIHTDKPIYKNCGQVFYSVGVYGLNNMPLTQNLTINIYDPNWNLMNQSRTSGAAVYNGVYSLQPGALIGEWLIQAIPCGIYSKTFGVGTGNPIDLWKMEWVMPDRVQYLPSQAVSFTLKFYNQIGEGIAPWPDPSSNPVGITIDGMGGGVSCSGQGVGMYSCSFTAPSSAGVHSINVYEFLPRTARYVNETRYFYVGG